MDNTDSLAALRGLLTKMADDELILGHRDSEWTGLGPILEEDIAFSSMAQDKIGHALALYTLLHERLGTPDPDHYAFLREAPEYRCCHLVELPTHDYAFALLRQLLFDLSEAIRYESLEDSSFEPLRLLSRKIRGELKYHTLHGREWVRQLGRAGGESHERLQAALHSCFPAAAGLFEPGDQEQRLIGDGVYPGEEVLYHRWLDRVYPLLSAAALNLPDPGQLVPAFGGRRGQHTVFLQPLLEEMGEVYRSDPETSW